MKWVLILYSVACLLSSCRKIDPEPASYGYGTEAEQTTSIDEILSNQTPMNINSPIGMTLAAFGSSSREWQTIDQMLQAEDWQELACNALPSEATSPGSGSYVLDSDGWIVKLPFNERCVGTRLFQGAKGSYPSGRYLIRFTGGGSLSVSGDANTVVALGSKLAAFDVITPSSSGVLLKISSLVAGNPIKDIQVIAPGGVCGKSLTELLPFSYCRTARGGSGKCGTGLTCFDFSETVINAADAADMNNFTSLVSGRTKLFFHPVFLQSLRPYKSLGFKNWLLTGSQFVKDLTRLNSNIAHFAAKTGAPPELASALSNLLDADPWLTVPADNSYALMTSMASHFKNKLDSHLAVYLDYGGEFWIDGSDARNYMTLAAEIAGLPSYEAFYLRRMATLAGVWKSTFGTDSSRIQIVGMVNALDPAMPSRLQSLANPLPFSHLAISARYKALLEEGESSADFFESIGGGDSISPEQSELGQTKKRILDMAGAAQSLNLPLLAFGSGPEFSPPLTLNDTRESFRNDARMGSLISQNLQTWKEAGGRLIFFDKSADDTHMSTAWGALRTQQDTRSKLANALREFIEANPCWWDECGGQTTKP